MIPLSFDINTVVNYLFGLSIAWVRSIEVRLRGVPDRIDETVEKSSAKLSHRMDRIEDKIDLILMKFDDKN